MLFHVYIKKGVHGHFAEKVRIYPFMFPCLDSFNFHIYLNERMTERQRRGEIWYLVGHCQSGWSQEPGIPSGTPSVGDWDLDTWIKFSNFLRHICRELSSWSQNWLSNMGFWCPGWWCKPLWHNINPSSGNWRRLFMDQQVWLDQPFACLKASVCHASDTDKTQTNRMQVSVSAHWNGWPSFSYPDYLLSLIVLSHVNSWSEICDPILSLGKMLTGRDWIQSPEANHRRFSLGWHLPCEYRIFF